MSKFKAVLALLSLFTFITSVLSSDVPEYVLEAGEKGSTRLDLQSKLLQPYTDEHLKEAGILEGQYVCDVGCGSGIVTVELAQRVGPKGHVWAIDSNKDQLKLIQERVANAGLTNVTFIHGDIRTLENLPFDEIDLVYMRSLLAHVNNPDRVIEVVKRLLKPGGVIASQEPIMTTYYSSSSPHEIFREYWEAIIRLSQKTGNNYEIGEQLLSLYEQSGFTKTKGYFKHQTIDLPTTKKLFLLDISEWTGKAIELCVLTLDTVEKWRRTMQEWSDDDPTQFKMANYAYVLAWK
jgi:ubiquinone/menaquinone biosynthesis C-methylase UbiE